MAKKKPTRTAPKSLRDEIAIEAMRAIIRKHPATQIATARGELPDQCVEIAIGAYQYADAMLHARKAVPNG